MSLMNKSLYEELHKRKLTVPVRRRVHLQTASGSALKVVGCVAVEFVVGHETMQHQFFVVDSLNRKIILGKDWLTNNGVRLYWDLGTLRVGKSYVTMEEDIHVARVVRVAADMIIKPQTITVCPVKTKGIPPEPNTLFEVGAVTKGFLSGEPGLMISNTVIKGNELSRFPLMVVNSTGKTYKIKRGCVIAQVHEVPVEGVINVRDMPHCTDNQKTIDWGDLQVAEEHREVITRLVEDNKHLFAATDLELGHTDTVRMNIDTGDATPIKMRPYRTPLTKREVVNKAIDNMLEAGVINKSTSAWAFPIVVVDKKDGSKRFCVDFRQLNKISKNMSYPLPVIDDILAQLKGAKYFSSLDLKSGYWQVKMADSDKEKTAFACHRGLFEFNVMPFGLSNAPGVFQELMAVVLSDSGHFALAYLDDILLFSRTLDEHLTHIQLVFDRLKQHGLKLKLSKCQFLRTETNYLGFVINKEGIQPEPQKVEVIRGLPEPRSVREVRSFIGMVGYYRRFVPNMSEIAEPLIALTRKHAHFKWTEKCQVAFDFIKESLTTIPLLTYPDPNLPYTLYTDASDHCVGACLTQVSEIDGVEKPLYFLSHRLSDTQTRWATIEKEAFAIYFALKKLDHYLHGAEFVIKCDHKPLKYVLDAPMQNRKIQLWALSIAGYNCQVEYIPGPQNMCADLLSRVPPSYFKDEPPELELDLDVDERTLEIAVLDSHQFDPRQLASCEADKIVDPSEEETDMFDMAAEQLKDEVVTGIMRDLKADNCPRTMDKRYMVKENVLYYITDPDNEPVMRVLVPSHLRSRVLTQYHDDNGHMGLDKTYDTAKSKYYWPNMYKTIHQYVSDCIVCQQRNLKKIKPPVQESDTPPYPFAKVGLDLSGPYTRTLAGNKYIVSFIDWYSGWVEAFAVPDKCADTIAHLILEEIFPRFGAPLEIVTDNGTENENKVVREVLQTLNIHHVRTSYYHPQGNAKVERCHRTLHDILSKLMKGDDTSWDVKLNQALAAMRFNVSETTKFSPYFLLYNRDVVLPLDNLMKPRRKYLGEEQHKIALEKQHHTFRLVHRHMKHAKQRQLKYANKNAKLVEIEVGDAVYHKNHQKSNKLQSNWRPYYRVVEKRTPLTFIIRNQLDGKVTKAHLEHLRLAKIDKWDIPKDALGRKVRRPNYVVPPSDSETDDQSDSKPMAKMAKRYRKERTDSSDEEDIPLMELAKRLKRRARNTETDETASSSSDEPASGSDSVPMEVGHVVKRRPMREQKKYQDYTKLCQHMLTGFQNIC